MIIKIGQPYAFTEQGQKDQQEDRIYPSVEQLSSEDKCFVLCDGMGGHEKGEVAASIVSQTLYKSLNSNPPVDNIADKAWFDKSLATAYDALDKMDSEAARRPGTTMTCVYLAANGALCAHIGDSRIYLVRPGEGIIFRTQDHSLVNQLVQIGEITPEEAEHHPKRNIITRAMQPQLERRYPADVKILTDIKAGDYFFLCCDGILEQLSDAKLTEIISADTERRTKLNDIYDVCFGKTRDNFTCILVPVTEVEGAPAVAKTRTAESAATVVTPTAPDFASARKKAAKTPVKQNATNLADARHKRSMLIIYSLVALIVILLGIGLYLFLGNDDSKEPEKSEKVKDPKDGVNPLTLPNRTANKTEPQENTVDQTQIDIINARSMPELLHEIQKMSENERDLIEDYLENKNLSNNEKENAITIFNNLSNIVGKHANGKSIDESSMRKIITQAVELYDSGEQQIEEILRNSDHSSNGYIQTAGLVQQTNNIGEVANPEKKDKKSKNKSQ